MFKRDISAEVLHSATYFSVIAILGPRQSGKTTLAQHLFPNHRYISLEDYDMREAAKHDPRGFLLINQNEDGLIIDEFQHVPELLSYIQTTVDREKKLGYYILTGSQDFLMNKAITQSLAGRVALHTLLPLSIHELAAAHQLPGTVEALLYEGCYPALYSKNTPASELYKNYVSSYLERDLRYFTQVGDLSTFKKFMGICAARIGQLLNLTSLARDCGISDATAKRWLSILEASYIVYLLQPYHNNLGKRLIKTPKLYFYDTGLACWLLGIKEKEVSLHPLRGSLFEALIISEIIKWHLNHDEISDIYFWRDSHGHEVDCIIKRGDQLIPIEIKASYTASSHFFDTLNYWSELYKQPEGYAIYAGASFDIRLYERLVSWQSIEQLMKKLELIPG